MNPALFWFARWLPHTSTSRAATLRSPQYTTGFFASSARRYRAALGSQAFVRAPSRASSAPEFGTYAPTTNTRGNSATTTRPSSLNAHSFFSSSQKCFVSLVSPSRVVFSVAINGSVHAFKGASRENSAVPLYPNLAVLQFQILCGYIASTRASISSTCFAWILVSCNTNTSAFSSRATRSKTSGSFSSNARIPFTFQETTRSAGTSLASGGARGGRGGSVTSQRITGEGFLALVDDLRRAGAPATLVDVVAPAEETSASAVTAPPAATRATSSLLFPPTRAPRERSTALSCATVSDSTRTASDRSADVDAARDDDDDDDDAKNASAFFLVPSSAASDAEVARGDVRAGVVGNGANRANRRVGGDARRARAGATPLSRAAHGGW